MNVLFVAPRQFNPIYGGIESVTYYISVDMLRGGVNVLFLHNVKPAHDETFQEVAPTYYFPNDVFFSSENIDFYHSFLKEHKIDVVVNQWGLFEGSKLYCNVGDSGAKVVSVLHCDPLFYYDRLWSYLYHLRNGSFIEKLKRIARCVLYFKIKRDLKKQYASHYNWLAEHSNRICLLSERHKGQFVKIGLGDSKKLNDKLVAIPNSIPDSMFGSRGVDEKENLILYVGRLDGGAKRADRVLKVWAKLYSQYPNWRLAICGDGPERKRLELYCIKRGIERVDFMGFVDPKPFYAKSKISCMTSTYEGFGMVLIEAMAMGCVPIAFDSFLAVRDIITDERQLVKPFSISEYATKLKYLMDDEKTLQELSSSVINQSRKFAIEGISQKWQNLFQSLC